MESINHVFLGGKVQSFEQGSNDQAILFWVLTNQKYYDRQNVKQWDSERHLVKLRNPGTIAKHIREGKHVVIVGRIKYTIEGDAYILAETVHFVGDRIG